ncbi:DUF6624 domain-containing protein [Hymenobacter properus]|uniref:Lytic transglycosylase domain-containing protein n=1 Tax=Hymenobacter properus TaxID=2791026 RepID=A0A931BJB3_9BACT|nr:DUF6624 domain-containing protein [Hymenobacter properus]MBF9142541.1 hypothetical protein [Hymenobacter properus]MBR7721348.1 hypothetical protein [Microvirga sp. SRT04]
MKLLLLLLLLGLLPQLGAAQASFNPRLKHELDSIYAVDQKWRSLLFDPHQRFRPDSVARALGVTRESLPTYIPQQMVRSDSANRVRVKQLIKQYGYPGKSLVGEPTNEAAWYVIQHSDDIKQYLPLIKKAANKGELPFYLYAQMLDRQLMRQGKEQLYGTQAMGYNVTNPATGRREGQRPFVWPIRDAADVNARRRKAGFKNTVEQNAALMGIPYRVVTLKEVAQMPKQ